jgi:Spy/CpxP family protein refolding chaperone
MKSVCSISLMTLILAVWTHSTCGGAPDPASSAPSARHAPASAPARPMDAAGIVNQLADQLELSDAQRTQYDALVAKYKDRWQGQAHRAGELRDLARAYRQARQGGETQRADEIRQQMRDLGGVRGQALGDFFNEVRAILTPEQAKTLDEFRQTMRGQTADAPAAGAGLRQIIQRLPDELGFAADQRTKFDALVAEQRAARTNQRGEVRPLVESLRAARQAGDNAQVAELEKQLADKRAAGGNGQTFLEKLQPILTDEQKAKLQDLRAKLGAAAQAPGDVRQVLQAARQLDLTEEQRGRLREIMRTTAAAARDAKDTDARTKLAASVKQKIVAMLDTDLAGKLEQMLAEAPRSGQAGPRGTSGAGGGRQQP